MNSFVVEDKTLIQIYIEYVINSCQYGSKLFSLNKAESLLKIQKLTPIKDYNVSSEIEKNYKSTDALFRQLQYFTELITNNNLSLKYDLSEIYVYVPKNNKKNVLEMPLLVIGNSLIVEKHENDVDKTSQYIGEYGNLFLSLISDKYSLPLNKTKQRQILEEIKCTPLYFALQRCIHPVKKERRVLMI